MIMKSSTDGKKKHYHVFLTPDPQKKPGVAIPQELMKAGEINDHTHDIEYDPLNGVWVLLPQDGHSHKGDINDKYRNTKLKKNDDDEEVTRFHAVLKRAIGLEKPSIEAGLKAQDYVDIEQWDPAIKSSLKNEGRPALQFDQVGMHTDKIIGYFLQDMPDIALYPVESGDETAVDIMTTVVKHILRNSDEDSLKEAVFSDTFIAGKGIFEIGMEFDRDLGGDIVIDSGDFNHVIFGPHRKMNAKDCEDIFKVRILSKEQLKLELPERAQEIIDSQMYRAYASNGGVTGIGNYDIDLWLKTPGKQWDPPAARKVPVASSSDMEKDLMSYVVVDWYRKAYFKEYIVKGPEGNEPPLRMKSSDASQLKKMKIPFVDRIAFVFEKVIVSNDIIAERFDTGFDFSPMSVSYGKKTRKGYKGKVVGALDQQDEINKRNSQNSDIVNKMAAYNYFYTGDTFDSPESEKDFIDNSAIPGSPYAD